MPDRTATELREIDDSEATDLPCDSEGCTRRAVVALRFHGQRGHVHDCAPHAAQLREWCDVAESRPLPCGWQHDGTMWTDQPRELR